MGIDVHLTKEKETLLPTLYGKALDSRIEDSILGDTFAADVVRRLDYDFEKLNLPKSASISLPVRAKHLDTWTREFIEAHPASTVLHLGCGLDSRVFRVDPPATVRWFDVDHPEVVDLRRQVYPQRSGYALIGAPLGDTSWLDSIPADRPVLVVAEGVVLYLRPRDGVALFRAITSRFPSGELIFDAYSRPMMWVTSRLPAVKKTGAVLSWAVDDPHEIERDVPGVRLVSAVPFLFMPELVSRMSSSRLQRMAYDVMGRSGYLRRMVQHLRYRF